MDEPNTQEKEERENQRYSLYSSAHNSDSESEEEDEDFEDLGWYVWVPSLSPSLGVQRCDDQQSLKSTNTEKLYQKEEKESQHLNPLYIPHSPERRQGSTLQSLQGTSTQAVLYDANDERNGYSIGMEYDPYYSSDISEYDDHDKNSGDDRWYSRLELFEEGFEMNWGGALPSVRLLCQCAFGAIALATIYLNHSWASSNLERPIVTQPHQPAPFDIHAAFEHGKSIPLCFSMRDQQPHTITKSCPKLPFPHS